MVENSRTAMRHKRDWKPASLDYDFLLEQDDEVTFIICLTELERQILLASLPPLMWKTRYFSDTQEIDTDLVQSWVSRTALVLMENCMNCSNVYMVNQAIYALYIDNLYQRYDGSTTSVNENCPTTNFDGDGSDERRMALCMGLTAYIKSYVKQWLQNAQVVLGLTALALFLFGVPVLGWVAVIMIGGVAFITQSYYDALSNEEAIDNLICDWLGGLEGTAIDRANWAAALSGLTYDPGTDEYMIWQVLSSEVPYDKQWVAFLDAIGNAWPIAESGIQDCVCDSCETEWTHVFLDGENGHEWWYVWPSYPYGTYDAVNDRFNGTTRPITGSYDYWDNMWLTDFEERTITRIKFWFEWDTRYKTGGIELASISRMVPTPVLTIKRFSGTSPGSGSGVIDTGVLCQKMSEIQCRSTAYHQDGVMTGYTRITRIEISGVGSDPFV